MATSTRAACVLVVLLACSSGSTGPGFTGGDDSGNGTTGGGSGSSGGGSGGNSSGGSGSSGGGSGGGSVDGSVTYPDVEAGTSFQDAQPITANLVDQTVTLTATPFTVPAGQEVFKCQIFANPFGGKTADIIQMDGTMSNGSHHFFLFNMDPTTLALRPGVSGGAQALQDCLGKGLEFHPFPYLSQQPHWIVQFPDPKTGAPMGYPLVGANSLMINVHFVNAGSTDVTASTSITLKTAKPGVVSTHVGTLFLNKTSLNVTTAPKTAPVWYESTWSPGGGLAQNYSIFASISHMHKWAVGFRAGVTGATPFYTEPNWDSPQLRIHTPPIAMTTSQSITWGCNYYNDTGQTLTFGDYANTNVMCIYMGQYFPADPTNPDIISAVN